MAPQKAGPGYVESIYVLSDVKAMSRLQISTERERAALNGLLSHSIVDGWREIRRLKADIESNLAGFMIDDLHLSPPQIAEIKQLLRECAELSATAAAEAVAKVPARWQHLFDAARRQDDGGLGRSWGF